jgi:cysteine desulfurase
VPETLYLDYAATTPVENDVADLMIKHMTRQGSFANAASLQHAPGQAAKQAVDLARLQVAELIGAEASEIIWTSGATESINLALKGAARMYGVQKKHIITSQTEHKAVLETCEYLEKAGYTLTYLPVQKNGLLALDALQAAIRPETFLVSIMHVNNETGVIQDIQSIGAVCAAHHILFHCDATQSIGKLKFNVRELAVDIASFSAHKLYGPKGIGVLYLRKKPRLKLSPLFHGGGQEQGLRAGTLPTHQIVGMGAACHIAEQRCSEDRKHFLNVRNQFLESLSSCNYVVNSDLALTTPHILNLQFCGVNAKALMHALPQLALATGSACNNKGIEPSYVLRAMGLSLAEAGASIRFSFGRYTSIEDVKWAAKLIVSALKQS